MVSVLSIMVSNKIGLVGSGKDARSTKSSPVWIRPRRVNWRPIRAFSADGDGQVRHLNPFGKFQKVFGIYFPLRVGIDDFSAGFAVKMDVFSEVGAEAGWGAVEIDLIDETAGSQGFEAVVDRGQRNRGHTLFDPDEYLGRGRVIKRSGEHLKHLAALFCHAKFARKAHLRCVHGTIAAFCVSYHCLGSNLVRTLLISRIIPIKMTI